MKRTILVALLSGAFLFAFGQKKDKNSSEENKSPLEKTSLGGLKLRNIGPATTSGRVADIAVHPQDQSTYYVATASGGVWKTENHGVTYFPIFDGQGSYSIGCVTIDPNNPNIIWVGTGENNNQRSVAYGDGLYKSEDGGKSWKNVGLKDSEHIGMIKVHPKNSNIVYVAAYGPLWSAGGDRGIYKTTDGGKNWEKVLEVSENTGFNEIHFDPRNPDVLYAAAHQRRRHVWTYISGGPESAIYKSTDAGKTWNKLEKGLPSGDKGRIALAIPPTQPDVVYALVEESGFYRSNDRGASFQKMSDHSTSGNYYVELIPHPTDPNIVYSMDTWAQVTRDGGKTFQQVGEKGKHVDNHCLWINPKDPEQMIMGCDGGLYETWDNAENWHFKTNLPVTQFYRVAVDNDSPFYNVYGGTQDNFSLGGPSRTTNRRGIVNSDWFVTNTGDGFESQVDPEEPNIVYAQAQYGGLVRFDRKSGDAIYIQPQPREGEKAFRWNWDAPLLISPHDHKTLYFAANKVFKSSDQGNTWSRISEDLTQQIDRNALPVMGKVWSVDAVAKNKSTTIYGNIVSLAESPLKKGLLYIGTDDGLIQVTEDDGGNWKKYESFPGIPENTYVQALTPSLHDENVIYAAFNNHKNGDFKPYLLKSTNQGKSWTSITGNLPEKGSVYAIAEDHKNPGLLFVGTEFGVFFTIDGGEKWIQLKAGLPTIAIRDIDIQRRENDLVLASFGRGFYILDDYSPLRHISNELVQKEAHIFPIKDGLLYLEASPLGYNPPGFLGSSYYMAPNPPVGATFTYFIKEAPKTLKQKRKSVEKEAETIKYPSAEELRAEDQEESSYLIFVISDSEGNEIRRITTAPGAGVQRITWDGRFASNASVSINGAPQTNAQQAFLAPEGNYSVRLMISENGKVRPLVGSTPFRLKHLKQSTLPAPSPSELFVFQSEIDKVNRELRALNAAYKKIQERITKLKAGIRNTPGADLTYLNNLRDMEKEMNEIEIDLNGDQSLSKREFETLPGLNGRMGMVVWTSYYSTSQPTQMQREGLEMVKKGMDRLEPRIESLNTKTQGLIDYLEQIGGPIIID
ncbi:MAG: glycosyl hydrolase [Bacteroidota bacterium]|nr:glycosyl hydrolase [Bacteroidota bacterium]MDX5505392.1 glycosyl hydrolase [Bacteroidota bacterium]